MNGTHIFVCQTKNDRRLHPIVRKFAHALTYFAPPDFPNLMERLEVLPPELVIFAPPKISHDLAASLRQVRAIKNSSAYTRILVALDKSATPATIAAFICAGAITYERNPNSRQRLHTIVDIALHEESVVEPDVAAYLLHKISTTPRLQPTITQYEMAVLRYLAYKDTPALTRLGIESDQLTLRSHVANICLKLAMHRFSEEDIIMLFDLQTAPKPTPARSGNILAPMYLVANRDGSASPLAPTVAILLRSPFTAMRRKTRDQRVWAKQRWRLGARPFLEQRPLRSQLLIHGRGILS